MGPVNTWKISYVHTCNQTRSNVCNQLVGLTHINLKAALRSKAYPLLSGGRLQGHEMWRHQLEKCHEVRCKVHKSVHELVWGKLVPPNHLSAPSFVLSDIFAFRQISFIELSHLYILEIVWEELVQRGTCPGGTCPKWKLSGGKLSFLDACLPGELVRRGSCPGGTCPQGHLSGGNLLAVYIQYKYTYKKMYIPDQTYSPTLRPKGAQKPSKWRTFPKCWQNISNTN